jgi:threonine/homoserine/homoserine lactone efflux protein
MTLAMWAAFAATEFALSLLPGPAVMLVCSHALRGGFRSGARGALGVIAGNLVYFTLAGLGLGALLVASSALFEAVKLAGAAYLAWLGVRMLVTREQPHAERTHAGQRSFAQGFLTQLGNPKALVFFTALLPQFVATQNALAPQFALLGLTSITLELPILLAYAWLAQHGRNHISAARARLGERTVGVVLIGLGLRLALPE